jgi:SAM-dependent methyltransferase
MSTIYNAPRYYDLAFSYREYDTEVDVMCACAEQFGLGVPRRVLEICCGHAPHMPAWLARGAAYVGVDRSTAMLDMARQLAAVKGGNVTFVAQDLADFALAEPVDFAYVLLGSLYARDTAHLHAHFHAVARALVTGGLYFMEWTVDFDPMVDVIDAWEVERDDIRIKASYWTRCVNRVEQIYEDALHLDIEDRGGQRVLEDRAVRRRMFPQEFRAYIAAHPLLEFVGWWNDWDLHQPIDGTAPVNRPIIVVRKV